MPRKRGTERAQPEMADAVDRPVGVELSDRSRLYRLEAKKGCFTFVEMPVTGAAIGGERVFRRRGMEFWGHSSVGRARALQARGHRFEPGCLHHSTRPVGLGLLVAGHDGATSALSK